MTQELRLSELHEVCAVGDSDLLEEMLKSGKYEHVDYKDPDWGERAPLHWCCMKGKADMVRHLLDKGAHPGVRSSCGWTPAHYAAETGRTHVLRTLHTNNAPMDRRDLFGDTPRRIAEIYGHVDAADFLTLAEAEYRAKRRKAELCGEAEPYDDEDVNWCYRNNITPEIFITEDELAEITSTATSGSLSTSMTSSILKGRTKQRRQGKAGKPPSRRNTPVQGDAKESRSGTPKRGHRRGSKPRQTKSPKS
ncbi:ankyrin repeat domain-containing protein 66-like [Ciona intestinalis]